MEPVKCPYCQKEAEKVAGDVLYPSRPELATKQFYRCQPCDACVGCHPTTGLPFGALANRALRRARMATHEAFDPLWEEGGMSRSEAYDWLSKELGISKDECHMGKFDEATCGRAISACDKERASKKSKAGNEFPF